MPFAKCPVCGDGFHLSVRGSIDEWARQHVRERSAEGIPLLKCIRCWVELRPGHQVTVRSAGQSGVVESASEADGRIGVRVGETLTEFRRDELLYVVGQPPLGQSIRALG